MAGDKRTEWVVQIQDDVTKATWRDVWHVRILSGKRRPTVLQMAEERGVVPKGATCRVLDVRSAETYYAGAGREALIEEL